MTNQPSRRAERFHQLLAGVAKSSGPSSDALFARQLLAQNLADLILREDEDFFVDSKQVRAALEKLFSTTTSDGSSIFACRLSESESIADRLVGILKYEENEQKAVGKLETCEQRWLAAAERDETTPEPLDSEQDVNNHYESRIW